MAQPYIGEIRMFAGNYAPRDWMLCEGQLLPIAEYDALFVLIGTTYGGDGESTFALPDLRGRLPLHRSEQFVLAESGGVEDVTLTVQQIPLHGHPLHGSSSVATDGSPAGKVPAESGVAGAYLYLEDTPAVDLAPTSVTAAGGSQPHTNLAPYLCLHFIISLAGIFPPRP